MPMILPDTPLNIPELMRRHGLRADKSLGQNFLQDPDALERITAAAEIQPDDSVLEIGPGLGSLTRYLCLNARRVIAVELDRRLFPALEQVLAGHTNMTLVQGDILDLAPSGLVGVDDYLVVANIPYYITSAVMRHLLEATRRPRRVVLTIQYEVAQRVCARPGEMSLLALSVQVYGDPQIAARIPAGAFIPAPQVDSAVLRVDMLPEARIPTGRIDAFFRLAKAGFSQKRKTLRNALSAGLARPPAEMESLLKAADIDPMRRAETLSLEEWRVLTEHAAPGDQRPG